MPADPVVGTARRIAFKRAVVLIGEDEVVTVWRDGTTAVLDIRRSNGPNYRMIARSCGYPGGDRDHRRYARHHDLTHVWLGEERGGVSNVLWHEAHGRTPPGAATEEHWVNCLQRLWADQLDGVDWREKEVAAAEEALGPDWRPRFDRLAALLSRV